jgi:DNA-binding GntR family transcriptional regulator
MDDPAFETFAPPAGYLLNVQRIVFIDELASTYDSVLLRLNVDAALIEALPTKFTYEVLKDHGIPVKRTRMAIDAAPASAEVQNAFSVPTGFPTLRRIYHHITADPSIAVYGMSVAPFDRLACTIELRPSVVNSTRRVSRMEQRDLARGPAEPAIHGQNEMM